MGINFLLQLFQIPRELVPWELISSKSSFYSLGNQIPRDLVPRELIFSKCCFYSQGNYFHYNVKNVTIIWPEPKFNLKRKLIKYNYSKIVEMCWLD